VRQRIPAIAGLPEAGPIIDEWPARTLREDEGVRRAHPAAA